MKFVGIIPARYESSRFPGKPLIDLKGKSMIQRVYEGASKSKYIDQVIVATDDQRIVDEVESFGGEVRLTSDKHRTGTDRCGEVAKTTNADVIINIQGDEPLVSATQLDQLCSAFNVPEVNIATLGIRTNDMTEVNNSNRIKIVVDNFGDALYFSRSAVPNSINASAEFLDNNPFVRHIGLYGYRKDTLDKITRLAPTSLEKIESLEQLRWLFYGYKIRVIETTIETPNIDVPEDVSAVLDLL